MRIFSIHKEFQWQQKFIILILRTEHFIALQLEAIITKCKWILNLSHDISFSVIKNIVVLSYYVILKDHFKGKI